MERLSHLLVKIEQLRFNTRWSCIEQLDNALNDLLYYLETIGHKASGELFELKSCSWVLHERYHMDNEEQMKWTFHHTKHKIIRSCRSLLEKEENKKIISMSDQETTPQKENSDLRTIVIG